MLVSLVLRGLLLILGLTVENPPLPELQSLPTVLCFAFQHSGLVLLLQAVSVPVSSRAVVSRIMLRFMCVPLMTLRTKFWPQVTLKTN